MKNRFAVPLQELERQTRPAQDTLIEIQAEIRLCAPMQAGPQMHPFGDGATGDDGD